MNFLGLGPGELFLVMLLALIVFGPGKLPEIGAGLGKAIREFRRASESITQELTRELSLETPPQQSQPAAAAAAEPTPLEEEPHPVAAPIDQELHPAPEPILEQPQQPEPAAEDASSVPEPAPARRRVRRVKPAVEESGNGEAEAATPVKRTRRARAKTPETPATEEMAASTPSAESPEA